MGKYLRLVDIPLHDPWIHAEKKSRVYYLYTSALPPDTGDERYGVKAYTSRDLADWEGPRVVFLIPDGMWANPAHGAWAPEVHAHKGRYYLFVTLHNRDRLIDQGSGDWGVGVTHDGAAYPPHMRGTQVFVSDSPAGPFASIPGGADGPHTRADFMTLDGTLFVEDGVPWMVYCHEWIQLIDGTIEAVRLKPDLSASIGEPILLFKASDAPWIAAREKVVQKASICVTDGPFLYLTTHGRLLILWSGYREGSYVQTFAFSESGRLHGPWRQCDPIVGGDSGHGMLFTTFEGRLMLVLHQPFRYPLSRAKLYEMEDTGGSVRVVRAREDLHGPAAV